MSKYESVLRGFMDARGVKSVAELHRRLLAAGHDVGYGRVLGNLKRPWQRRGRDPKLNMAIARVLGLSEREMARLAMANMGWG